MIGSDGHIRIIDLGFAKVCKNEKIQSIWGTQGYLSPEQVLKLSILKLDYGM